MLFMHMPDQSHQSPQSDCRWAKYHKSQSFKAPQLAVLIPVIRNSWLVRKNALFGVIASTGTQNVKRKQHVGHGGWFNDCERQDVVQHWFGKTVVWIYVFLKLMFLTSLRMRRSGEGVSVLQKTHCFGCFDFRCCCCKFQNQKASCQKCMTKKTALIVGLPWSKRPPNMTWWNSIFHRLRVCHSPFSLDDRELLPFQLRRENRRWRFLWFDRPECLSRFTCNLHRSVGMRDVDI